MTGMSAKTRAFIVSKEYHKIQDFVIQEIGRGVTIHEVVGGYTQERRIQLEILLTREEFAKLMEFMSREEISAFVTSDTVNEVYGLWNKKAKLKLM